MCTTWHWLVWNRKTDFYLAIHLIHELQINRKHYSTMLHETYWAIFQPKKDPLIMRWIRFILSFVFAGAKVTLVAYHARRREFRWCLSRLVFMGLCTKCRIINLILLCYKIWQCVSRNEVFISTYNSTKNYLNTNWIWSVVDVDFSFFLIKTTHTLKYVLVSCLIIIRR